jgi:hypothetical protein
LTDIPERGIDIHHVAYVYCNLICYKLGFSVPHSIA